MLADLPPSSSVTRLRLPAAPRRICRPTAGEPVKVILSTSGMFDQRRTRGGAVAGDDVEHAGRNAGLQCQFADAQRGERGELGGLEHHGAAAGQCRRDFPHADHERKIPGHDGAHHADRLAHRVGQRVGARRNHLAVDLVGPAGVVGRGCRAPPAGPGAGWPIPACPSRGSPAPSARSACWRMQLSEGAAAAARGRPARMWPHGPSNAARAERTAASMSAASPAATRAIGLLGGGIQRVEVAAGLRPAASRQSAVRASVSARPAWTSRHWRPQICQSDVSYDDVPPELG